jgi:protein tyrosine phosphatase (PTP) superfamily phosphohydrolase (DUF442 family)
MGAPTGLGEEFKHSHVFVQPRATERKQAARAAGLTAHFIAR